MTAWIDHVPPSAGASRPSRLHLQAIFHVSSVRMTVVGATTFGPTSTMSASNAPLKTPTGSSMVVLGMRGLLVWGIRRSHARGCRLPAACPALGRCLGLDVSPPDAVNERLRVLRRGRAQRQAQRDDAGLELAQREAVLALPGVARHELALHLLAPRLRGDDPPRDRGPVVQRIGLAMVLEELVEDLEVDGLELAPARLHPLLVGIVVEEPAGVERVGRLQQRQRGAAVAAVRLAGEALELADVVPQVELGCQRIAAVLEDDVLHVAVDLAQEPAQRVHRAVEVVARGKSE